MSFASIDSNTEKRILRIFFPGLLAIWPLCVAGIKWIYNDPFWGKLKSDNIIFNGISSALGLVMIYGIGHLIEKMALRLEVQIDNCYKKKEKKMDNFREDDAKNFDNVWYNYLKKTFKKDNEPIILRYYSGFITAYKFELSCIIALMIQIPLLICCDLFYTDGFECWGLLLVIGIEACMVLYLYFVEVKNATAQAHELRQQIIECKDS